jgi:hypothetical protein
MVIVTAFASLAIGIFTHAGIITYASIIIAYATIAAF